MLKGESGGSGARTWAYHSADKVWLFVTVCQNKLTTCLYRDETIQQIIASRVTMRDDVEG
jgi:hypothetical protein